MEGWGAWDWGLWYLPFNPPSIPSISSVTMKDKTHFKEKTG